MKSSILMLGAVLILQSFSYQPVSVKPVKKINSSVVLNAEFGDIHVHKQGPGVKIQWSMVNSTGVSSYEVQVTYEDPLDQYSNWATKGTVTAGKKVSMFTDNTDVFPGDAYYRIVATTTAGDVTSNYQWINIQ